MKSLAIVRASDILKLKSTLLEMSRAGLDYEDKPKEINPSSLEKTLSMASGKKYEICALVPILQDCISSERVIKKIPPYSDVLILDPSHEIYNDLVKLIPVLPDLEIPNVYYKELSRKRETSEEKTSKEKPGGVHLGVFVNRKVQVETNSGAIHTGILRHADTIGVFFEPSDNSASIFFTWHDIKKVIIPREDMK